MTWNSSIWLAQRLRCKASERGAKLPYATKSKYTWKHQAQGATTMDNSTPDTHEASRVLALGHVAGYLATVVAMPVLASQLHDASPVALVSALTLAMVVMRLVLRAALVANMEPEGAGLAVRRADLAVVVAVFASAGTVLSLDAMYASALPVAASVVAVLLAVALTSAGGSGLALKLHLQVLTRKSHWGSAHVATLTK
jgi:hypothetical protein